MSNQVIINVKDLFINIVLKWKKIIIWMIIGMILLDALSMYKTYTTLKAQSVSVEANTLETEINAYAAELNAEEKNEADATFELYKISLEKYQNGIAYNAKSLLMKLNSNEVPTNSLVYHVDNVNIKDVISVVGAALDDTSIYKELADQNEWITDVNYVRELINIDELTNDDISNMKNSQISLEEAQQTHFFRVDIVAGNQETCNQIAELVKEIVKNQMTVLDATYPNLGINLVSEKYTQNSNSDILAMQQNRLNNVYTLKNSLLTLTNGFSGNQVNYYNALCLNYTSDLKKEEVDESSASDVEGSTEQIENNAASGVDFSQIRLINMKYILVGAVLGIFFGVLFYVIMFLCSKRLRSARDLEHMHDIPVLGVYRDQKKRDIFSDFVVSEYYKNRVDLIDKDQMELVAAEIKTRLSKSDITNITIVQSENDIKTKEISMDIAKRLSKLTSYQFEVKETFANAEAVLLIETTNVSLYQSISRKAKLCEKLDIVAVGSIVIEQLA